MSLLNKPKRTLSQFSIEDFSNIKQICKTSFQQYRSKFHYQPDCDNFYNNRSNQIITNHQKKRKSQTNRILFSNHSYSVQSKRNSNTTDQEPQSNNTNKKRPLTAKLLFKKAQKMKKDGLLTQIKLSQLFQNEHLSSTLQTSQSNITKNQDYQIHQLNFTSPSQINNRTSVCSKKFITKAKITYFKEEIGSQEHAIKKEGQEQRISRILSKKENYYNPYNIGPKIKDRKFIQPMKTLKNQSIKQLKQLFKEQRRINFTQNLVEKEKNFVQQVNKYRYEMVENFYFKNQKENPIKSQPTINMINNRELKLEKKGITNKVRQFKKATGQKVISTLNQIDLAIT